MNADSVTVTTWEELKKAIKEKHDQIIVIGKLATHVKKAEKIKKLSPFALSTIAALEAVAITAAPATGGGSVAFFAVAAAPAAVATGLSIATILAIGFIGLGLLSILLDEYSRFEMGAEKIVFERKRSREKNGNSTLSS